VIDLIGPERIAADMVAGGKREALLELAQLVQKTCPAIDAEKLRTTLWEREMLGSTGLGDSIAIPHGKISEIEKIEIFFGRSVKGLPFDALDNKPTHLFFLLLAPIKSAAPYLRCLGQLSRFLKSPHVRSQLLHASDTDEIVKILAGIREFS
jgi:PTS system nitrogen regulatory IIA component